MVWKNRLQLAEEYKDPEFRNKFAELYSISILLQSCIVRDGYLPPQELGNAILLSQVGQGLLSRLKDENEAFPEIYVKIALFLEFFHQDLFIDVDTTDGDQIQKILHTEILNGNILYPWVFDRCLYDRFFEMFQDQNELLTHDETMQLLHDTPPGVFQIQQFVVGPFGILHSCCKRDLRPRRDAPLWHCPDPSCSALHAVVLTTGSTQVGIIAKKIRQISAEEVGLISDWHSFYRQCVYRSNHYDDLHPGKLPWLLGNGFSDIELQELIIHLFERHPSELRNRLPKDKSTRKIFADHPNKIGPKLTKAQCLQLALLLADETLVESIEKLVEDKTIVIPPNEIRTPKLWIRTRSWFDVMWQSSQFGVRALVRKENLYIARLKKLIKELYKEPGDIDQLSWVLRHIRGKNLAEKLDNYLQLEDPKEIIKQLFLSRQDRLELAFKLLRYGNFELPKDEEDEEYLINKILWKLGFDIQVYPPFHDRFCKRHYQFLDISRRNQGAQEEEREQIRSSAANYFVSLEEILDHSLSFITWVLLSDHYGSTRYKFNLDDARRFMASKLNSNGNMKTITNEPLRFDSEGVNTLYPLIQGFRSLALLCQEILDANPNQFMRSKNEFPGYFKETEMFAFPFLHKILLLDINEEDREQILKNLSEVTVKLEQAKVSNIRNRLEHKKRDHEFPNQVEIETACNAISEVIEIMESTGIYPLIYIYSNKSVDRYKRALVTLRNYRGKEVTFFEPYYYRHFGFPSYYSPIIVVPSIHVGDSSGFLSFSWEEKSEYEKMWVDYPKRKMQIIED